MMADEEMLEAPGPTEEEMLEAAAMDAAIDEDRSPEEQERRVAEVAAAVARENHDAPSEEEVDALYAGEPTPGWREAFEGLDTTGYDLLGDADVDAEEIDGVQELEGG